MFMPMNKSGALSKANTSSEPTSNMVQTSQDDSDHLKLWYRQHHFDIQNDFDRELIVTMRKNKDLHYLIPPLPQGARFLPILKVLSYERKLDILMAINDDLVAAQTLTHLLCQSSKSSEELDRFETLQELWLIVEASDREGLILDLRHGTDTAVIIRAALTGPVKNFKYQKCEEDAKRDIQNLWDTLQPQDRKKLGQLLTKKPNRGN